MEPTLLKKIYLVDDDFFNLTLCQQHLINLGYPQVQTFSNGLDCLDNLQERPDVIFLDHLMEDISGLDLLKKIKRFDPDIPVIMLSGQENMKTAIDSLKYGAFDYIIKGEDTEKRITDVMERLEALYRLTFIP